jgi:hypothetical protein
MPRPSGLPIVADEQAKVIVAVAYVEERGRLNILPRWRRKVEWLRSAGTKSVEALMIFSEPGLISLRSWDSSAPAVVQKIEELSKSSDEDSLEAIRLIQDRYQKLIIPAKDRPTLGDEALAHLGVDLVTTNKFLIYVCTSGDRIDLMSSQHRNNKRIGGHQLIDDLP